MYVMREETGASLPQIGRALGGRDHTTVIHGCERVARHIESDPNLRRQVAELREQLYRPVELPVLASGHLTQETEPVLELIGAGRRARPAPRQAKVRTS
jgi:hypothetical protein